MKKDPLLSVVVPFHNEPGIDKTYHQFVHFLSHNIPRFELIFVNDGSTDDSLLKLRRIKKRNTTIISYHPNRGRGYAVLCGMRKAKGDFVAYIDSDQEIPINYVAVLYKLLKKYPVVIGNKFHPRSKVTTRTIRRVGSAVANMMTRFLFRSRIKDHHVGLKGLRKDVVFDIINDVGQYGWTFDDELLVRIQQKKHTIYEMPVSIKYGTGTIRLSFIRYFFDLIKFALFFHLEKATKGSRIGERNR